MPRGQPKLNIESDKVREYARLGLKATEIAGLLDCDEATVRKRFKRELAEGRGQRAEALRKAQWDAAMAGNVTMLIWLGKNELGQRDTPDEDTGTETRTVKFRPINFTKPPDANG